MTIIKTIETPQSPRISVAPMMDWTTKDYRFFARLFNPNVILYTEMVTTGAILFGGANRHLDYNNEEHPIVLQLGGSNPKDLATCTKMAQDWGYDEVNLNVGCPSDRVQNNKIGACLMAEPDLVAECIAEMQNAVDIPVTVKHRIGIDDMQSYEEMLHFVDTVAKTGCNNFIVHARIALLQGLSPKENREVPPLRYEDVYRLKQECPNLLIEINGGIKTFAETQEHLKHVDGVMIGREAYITPTFWQSWGSCGIWIYLIVLKLLTKCCRILQSVWLRVRHCRLSRAIFLGYSKTFRALASGVRL